MSTIVVTSSTAVVEVTANNAATVNVAGAATATINQNQSVLVTEPTIQGVQSISSPDFIQFNQNAVVTPQVARLNWNDTDGTFEFVMKGGQVTQQIGMEQLILVKSSTNSELEDGKVIYATGSDGINILANYALATSESASSKTLAVMTQTVTGGNKGYATTFGLVRGLNTSSLTEGAAIWLSPTTPGGMTTVKPSAPDHLVFIGYCLRSNQNNGVVFVAIQNGYELEELHNVKITNVSNGQVLTYNSTSGLWENQNVVNAQALVDNHVADSTPHPIYDDMASLSLQFENGLI